MTTSTVGRGRRLRSAGLVTALILATGMAAAIAGAPVVLSAAAAAQVSGNPPTGPALPPANARVDYQLGGAYPPPRGVTVVARDWRDPAPDSSYGICYLNAFQTQPQMRGWWRRHHPGLLLLHRDGSLFEDPNWPGEILLDISTRSDRAELLTIIKTWIGRCSTGGYRAIEADNLDSWQRSDGLLRRSQTLAMARSIVRLGHRQGLAVAQKNAVSLTRLRARTGFDFVVTEDCQQYHECGRYRAGYDTAMIEIEYPDGAGSGGFRRACAARGTAISIVYRDRDLVPAGRPGYRFATC